MLSSSSAKKTLRFISVRFFQCRRLPDDNSQARYTLRFSLSLSLPVTRLSSSVDTSLSLSFSSSSSLVSLRTDTERTNGLRPDARIEAWSIESFRLSRTRIYIHTSLEHGPSFEHGHRIRATIRASLESGQRYIYICIYI